MRKHNWKRNVLCLLLHGNQQWWKVRMFLMQMPPHFSLWVLVFANRNKPNFSHQDIPHYSFNLSREFFFFPHISAEVFKQNLILAKQSHRWSEAQSFDGWMTDAIIFKVHLNVRKMNKVQREIKILSNACFEGSLKYSWCFL